MSTTRDPKLEASADLDNGDELEDIEDEFRFGWRHLPRRSPEGAWLIPLTQLDLLHPREEDFAVQLPIHIETCLDLMAWLKPRLTDRPSAYVFFDHRIDLGLPGTPAVGPDLAVYLDVEHDFDLGTYRPTGSNGRPILVVEVSSSSTRVFDFAQKRTFYAEAGFPTYVIVDIRGRGPHRRLSIIGHRLGPDGTYEIAPDDDRGRFHLGEPLDLWLSIEDRRVVCHDGATGERLPRFDEMDRAMRAAQDKALQAEDLASQTEDRADIEAQRRLVEERARSRAEDRAEAEAQRRLAEEHARSRAEDRADGAEARMRELEAELRRLRGEG